MTGWALAVVLGGTCLSMLAVRYWRRDPHQHEWVITAASEARRTAGTEYLTDVENHGRPVTLVLRRCTGCSATYTAEIAGHWPLSALTGTYHIDTGEQAR